MSQVMLHTSHNLSSSLDKLAQQAVYALLHELHLTPKPGLVDLRSAGAHKDLNLNLMQRSVYTLYPIFYYLVQRSWGKPINAMLRQDIGAIGRIGEQRMYYTTGGVNTHRGAIWSLGLLVSAAASHYGYCNVNQLLDSAAKLAGLPDDQFLNRNSSGQVMMQRYQVVGARGEAQQGFPHIRCYAQPQLHYSRALGIDEESARLNALLAIMAHLNDTCLLSRGGMAKLKHIQQLAQHILTLGGITTSEGKTAYIRLEKMMLVDYLSPGGAADLLAATLFVEEFSND